MLTLVAQLPRLLDDTMNFKQLEAFLAFMNDGSTIEAARRLGTSQSAVSRLLSQLEEDLGVQLFLRRK